MILVLAPVIPAPQQTTATGGKLLSAAPTAHGVTVESLIAAAVIPWTSDRTASYGGLL